MVLKNICIYNIYIIYIHTHTERGSVYTHTHTHTHTNTKILDHWPVSFTYVIFIDMSELTDGIKDIALR